MFDVGFGLAWVRLGVRIRVGQGRVAQLETVYFYNQACLLFVAQLELKFVYNHACLFITAYLYLPIYTFD